MTLPSSYRRANNTDDGPFRRVIALDNHPACYTAEGRYVGPETWIERLECGHRGSTFSNRQVAGWRQEKLDAGKKIRRRCWACRTDDSYRDWTCPKCGATCAPDEGVCMLCGAEE